MSVPIEVTEYYGAEHADRPKKDFRDKVRLILEIVIALATVTTLVVLTTQLREMQRQTRAAIAAAKSAEQGVADADRNFRRDERAWVTAIRDPFAFAPGSPIAISGHIVNTGKTPARHVRMSATTVLLGRNDVPEFIYEAGTGHPTTKIESDIFFPNAPPLQFQAPAFKQHIKTLETTVLTQELAASISTGKTFIVMHGEITYDDVFGISHWETYCNLYPQSFGVRKAGEPLPPVVDACLKHNGIDQN